MSIAEAQQFLSDVISQGSKLPLIDFSTYVSPVQM